MYNNESLKKRLITNSGFMKKLYRYIYVCIVLANDSTNVVKVVDVVVIWSIKKKKIFLIYTTR